MKVLQPQAVLVNNLLSFCFFFEHVDIHATIFLLWLSNHFYSKSVFLVTVASLPCEYTIFFPVVCC